jgi:hypothetical protein
MLLFLTSMQKRKFPIHFSHYFDILKDKSTFTYCVHCRENSIVKAANDEKPQSYPPLLLFFSAYFHFQYHFVCFLSFIIFFPLLFCQLSKMCRLTGERVVPMRSTPTASSPVREAHQQQSVKGRGKNRKLLLEKIFLRN